MEALPRYALHTSREVQRVLRAPEPTAMSTIEAVAVALGQMGFEAARDDLLKLYDAFADASARQRGQTRGGCLPS